MTISFHPQNKILNNPRRIIGFTLIELIIVISIISILATIIILALNPSNLFTNARNSNRAQDISTYQAAFGKYIADSPINTTGRSYDDFSGISSLYGSATTPPYFGSCPNGTLGQNLLSSNSYTIDNTGNPNTINIQTLIDSGNIPKVLNDPISQSGYNACIDTSNGNQLVIFAGNTEGSTSASYTPLQQLNTTTVSSLNSGVSGGSGGVGSPTSTSYICPTGSTYSNASCSPQSTYYSVIQGTTGSAPYGITIDLSGNMYIANSGSNNVSKITPQGVSNIFANTGNAPVGITIDSSGNIYTANNGSNNVSRITPQGVSSILGTTGNGPVNITIDSSGNIYTVNQGSNNVSKITQAGVSSTLGTTGSGSYAITIDSSGNVYTANQGLNNVSKITPSGVSSILGSTGSSPNGITVDSSGNIYTTNYNSNNVSKITPAGVSSILGTTGNVPEGIVIDSSGNAYTANQGSNNVSRITSSGVSSILGTTGSQPYAIKLDSFGNIYTTNNLSNNVSRLSQNVNSILSISPSTIKVNQGYKIGVNNVINNGVRVTSPQTCSIQITDTNTSTVLNTLSGNMNNGGCSTVSFPAVTTTHQLSIRVTISGTGQVFTYLTTPQ